MSNNKVQFRTEDRENVPKEGLSLMNYYVNQENIPIDKNWFNRPCTLTKCFAKYIDRTLNFTCRDDDVWVVTMPKCGTTWMQEAAWLVNNDFNFEEANLVPIGIRSTFFEFTGVMDNDFDTYAEAEKLKSPRLLKSHLPANFLPKEVWEKKNKIIYVARNMKDVAISLYHFVKALSVFNGTKDQFLKALMEDNIYYCPFWSHLLEFYEMRNEKNIFFTTYEKMKTDLRSVIKDLCVFLEKPIPSEDILDKAMEHLDFKNMKESISGKFMQLIIDGVKAENNNSEDNFEFWRRGIVGAFKDELTLEQIKMIDDWCIKYLEKVGFSSEEELYSTV